MGLNWVEAWVFVGVSHTCVEVASEVALFRSA
jgi:hypothetical protein